MANAMLCIEIYKLHGIWCFSDEKRELVDEPFILGMTELITAALKHTNLYEFNKKYRILFSGYDFPFNNGYLNKLGEERGGAWYEWNENKGWLCPATLKFFEQFPEKIYFKLENA